MNELNVKELRKALGLTQKQLAEKIGVHIRTVQVWESGGAIPETKYAILRNLKENTGEGTMLRAEAGHGAASSLTTDGEEADDQPQNLVPLVPYAAQGGTLAEFSQSVTRGQLVEHIQAPCSGVDFAIPVRGDSMSPDIPAGAVVFVRRVNERAFLEWGKVYILDTANGMVIKKLLPADTPDRVSCVSINPAFPPFEVEWQYVLGVYRVVVMLVTM